MTLEMYGQIRNCFSERIAWTPTLAWTTGTPAAITTIARYCRIGIMCFFDINISSADSNGCSALTITLPITPVDNEMALPCAAIQLAGAGGADYSNPLAFINADGTSNKIEFRAFTAATDGQNIRIQVSGCYEVESV